MIKPFDHSLKSINKENTHVDSPPPIPPRPVKNKLRRFDDILPPPLHHNHVSSSNETIENIRHRLREEFPFEISRIDAALILTEGLTPSKQYTMAKFFLSQVKYEHEQLFHDTSRL